MSTLKCPRSLRGLSEKQQGAIGVFLFLKNNFSNNIAFGIIPSEPFV